jgi:tRNA(Met) C34 N-acetyltransferase TmcA
LDDLTPGFSVIQELDELRCGRLAGVRVVRIATVTKLTERGRRP